MRKKTALLIFVTFILCSCSLNYGNVSDDDSWAPEFIFENIHMVKVEKGKKDNEIRAERMEQYRDKDAVFAQNVSFIVYNDENKISIEGICGFLSADNDEDIYVLSDNVKAVSYEQDFQVESMTLRWNNKTEQLASGKDELITITTGLKMNNPEYAEPDKKTENSLVMTGYGLAASGVSRTYSITENVEGTIITGKTE